MHKMFGLGHVGEHEGRCIGPLNIFDQCQALRLLGQKPSLCCRDTVMKYSHETPNWWSFLD